MSADTSAPPDVVHVVRSAGVGGVETHVINLCRAARARGYRVMVVSLVQGPVQEGFTQLGVRVLCLGDRQEWSARLVAAMFQLARLLRRLRPFLVHLHGVRPILIGSLAARIALVRPVVSTLHGSYSLMAIDESGRLRRSLAVAAKFIHFTGFALSHRILVDCYALERDVSQVYAGLSLSFDRIRERKVRVVHNAIDIEELDSSEVRGDLRAELKLRRDVVVFGTVSRLDEPKKGLAVLLEAFAAATARGPASHLLVVGDGFSRRSLEERARGLGIAERVSFLGFHRHLPDVYRALDVFVLPSFSEGFPTVTLEAMAFSLPIITTDVGGCAEAVTPRHNGAVVPPRDPSALAAAMSALLIDGTARSEMGARSRAIVASRFSVAQMAASVFRVYGEVSTRFSDESDPGDAAITRRATATRLSE